MERLKFKFKFKKNWAPYLIFIIMLFISHVLLPKYNDTKDWFFFSAWKLYSSSDHKRTYDLSWDQGKTFFFRDHRDLAWKSGIDVRKAFVFFNRYVGAQGGHNKEVLKVQLEMQLDNLKNFCKCNKFYLYQIGISRFDHIILKKEAAINIMEIL
jgi:hypothetical protein